MGGQNHAEKNAFMILSIHDSVKASQNGGPVLPGWIHTGSLSPGIAANDIGTHEYAPRRS